MIVSLDKSISQSPLTSQLFIKLSPFFVCYMALYNTVWTELYHDIKRGSIVLVYTSSNVNFPSGIL